MEELNLEIKLLSDTIIGSGEGYGAIIDTDIVFDDMGIPYIPSRRIKGCLRDSANQICCYLDLQKNAETKEYFIVEKVFGTGYEDSILTISDFYLIDYHNLRQCLTYLNKQRGDIFYKDAVLEHFTYLRQHTSINEEGITKRNSLRTVRCLKKGFSFHGKIIIKDRASEILELMILTIKNFRQIGTRRNRGFGEIRCTLDKKDTPKFSEIIKRLEEGCLKLNTL